MNASDKEILVVEDDKSISEVLKMALELDGYQVAAANDGQEALNYIKQGHLPNLVLLDLMMPVMNGWQFLEQLAEEPTLKDLPVIIVSAYCHRARDLKCRAFHEKPMDLDRLLSQVKQYMR